MRCELVSVMQGDLELWAAGGSHLAMQHPSPRGELMFPQLGKFADSSLLLLRLLVALVFLTSGFYHLRDSKARGASIGLSVGLTRFLGVAEVLGSLGVALGVLVQPAAVGLILIMLGAIQRKMFVWHTGFWGEKNSGWHYDLMLTVMNLVIISTGGGKFLLWK
jgi:putative oxidoreductase